MILLQELFEKLLKSDIIEGQILMLEVFFKSSLQVFTSMKVKELRLDSIDAKLIKYIIYLPTRK